MPNCPNCNTWNPEDKTLCWRCQTELPKPDPPKKKRQTILGFPIWMWVLLLVFFAVTTFSQCSFVGVPPA